MVFAPFEGSAHPPHFRPPPRGRVLGWLDPGAENSEGINNLCWWNGALVGLALLTPPLSMQCLYVLSMLCLCVFPWEKSLKKIHVVGTSEAGLGEVLLILCLNTFKLTNTPPKMKENFFLREAPDIFFQCST